MAQTNDTPSEMPTMRLRWRKLWSWETLQNNTVMSPTCSEGGNDHFVLEQCFYRVGSSDEIWREVELAKER